MKIILLGVFLLGCHPAPPVPKPDAPEVLPSCAEPSTAQTIDVCDRLFTPTGLACVRCPTQQGCVDLQTKVYCVQSACLIDPLCRQP